MRLSAQLLCALSPALLPPHVLAQESTASAHWPGPGEPQWIWSHPNEVGKEEGAAFRREFKLPEDATSAELVGRCDNAMKVWLNGALLIVSEDWLDESRVQAQGQLRAGANVLEVHATNQGGVAGLWLALTWTGADGEREGLGTDISWLARAEPGEGWRDEPFDAREWQGAATFGPLETYPWGFFLEQAGLGGWPTDVQWEPPGQQPPAAEPDDAPSAPPAGQAPTTAEVSPPDPQWIWSNAESPGSEAVWFQREFTLTSEPQSAELYGSCDNRMTIWINGQRLLVSGEWTQPVKLPVEGLLKEGSNTVAVAAENEGGPAGLYLELRLNSGTDEAWTLGTDSTWSCTLERPENFGAADLSPGAGWSPAIPMGPMGAAPWGVLGAGTQPARWGALPAEELELPEGFQAELLYSVPKETQGSWVSMTFDDRGRIIASDQYGALYRVSVPGLGESGVEVEALEVEARQAQGLQWAFGSLYVVENSGTSGLWRMTDEDGDDQFERVERLADFHGSGEHGPHAVRPGPKGEWLYLIAGNHTDLPEEVVASMVPRVWAEDQLLPRRPDPNGHANGVMAPGGWVVRLRPDGSEWELVACGLRNAYDIDFNAEGELFTFDSDMEWDVGLPWYRPTRVVHLVSGADFGWRHGSGKWPSYFADSLPAAVDVGLSSPTGIGFGTQANFPPAWQRSLFVQDWAYGTIYAVHLDAEGASYSGSFEPFVTGQPLPVTDLDVGPDGALYFTTGGRRTQSGLYRVTYGDGLQAPAPAEEGPEAPPERRLRHLLETLHGHSHPQVLEAAWRYLGHGDRFVRHAARTALEHQDPGGWSERALKEEQDPRAVVQALIALVRTGSPDDAPAILERAFELSIEDWPAEPLLEALRLFGLTFARTGEPAGGYRARLAARLAALYPHADEGVNRELCRLLVYLGEPSVVAATLPMLERGAPSDRIFYGWQLRNMKRGWGAAQEEQYFRWLGAALAEYQGGHSFGKYLRGMRDDALLRLEGARHGELEALSNAETVEANAQAAREPRPFVRVWTRAEVEPLLPQLQTGRSFEAGREMYAATSCFDCHRFAEEGGGPGPDLTGAGSRFSPSDLLEALLEPSSTISDQYQDTAVVLDDDRFLVGRVESEGGGVLILSEAPHGDTQLVLQLDSIVERGPHPVSRMPAGLLDILEAEELLDLMAFVLSGGDPGAPAFQSDP